MKRWRIYILLYVVVGSLAASPFQATDVAKLAPVEVVWLEEENGTVRIETESGEIGLGATIAEALENMKATASATVFLDTVDYLIVQSGKERLVSHLRDVIRPSCSLCVAEDKPDLEKAVDFLRIHEPMIKLKDFQTEKDILPMLCEMEGRFKLNE